MAVRLHKTGGLFSDPSKQVRQALDAQGIEYEVVKSSKAELLAHTHQDKFPAIELEDGTWYWEEPSDMALRINKGELEMAAHEPVPESEWAPEEKQTADEQDEVLAQIKAEAIREQNERGSQQWQG